MSAAPSAVLPADAAFLPEAAGLRDFSDRLSPMLVKELRQGLRSPIFVWGLIGMNLCMAMVVWLTMEDSGSESLNQAFFGACCVVVCGLLPLRGANALHEELKGNTIDTLVLTRLSGWRITLGKWVAVAAQQVLTMVTVLPYLIVRYFAGGLNVPLELAWLGVFLLLGLLAGAVLTGFSWLKYFLLRAAVMLGVTAASGAFCTAVLEEIYGYSNEYILDELYSHFGWRFFAIALVAVLHTMFFALDIGAAQVSAPSENRATRRRLVGLSAALIYFGLGLWGSSGTVRTSYNPGFLLGMGSMLAGVTIMVLALQALLERPANLAPVLLPFARKGRIGRLAGRLLYPGWPSGVVFSLCILLALAVGGWLAWSGWISETSSPHYSRHYSRGYYPYFLSDRWLTMWSALICGFAVIPFTLPVPLVLYHWFFRSRLNWHLGTWVLMLTLLGAVELLLLALASGTENALFLKLGVPIPTMSWTWLQYLPPDYYGDDFLVDGFGRIVRDPRWLSWDRPVIIVISLAVGAFWWIMALWLALRAFRETSAAERELKAGAGESKKEPAALRERGEEEKSAAAG
ncbi:MAG: hypothetical protein JWM59_2833 [Verrucomicrobiales bacterium]|nr:hypothetical protein [Verrucomicrobiales bacterium]